MATARKLAVIIWNMIIKAQPYQKSQVEVNSQKQRAIKLKQLNKKLHALELTKEELKRCSQDIHFQPYNSQLYRKRRSAS
jgi:hypothetical protein